MDSIESAANAVATLHNSSVYTLVCDLDEISELAWKVITSFLCYIW